MQMSVAIGPYGSYDPVETPKPLWGSPGAELSTWTTFQFCCETAIHRTRIASRPSRAIQLYSAIQRYTLCSYTSLYTIQPLQHPSGRRLLGWSRRLAPPRGGWSRRLIGVEPRLHPRRGAERASALVPRGNLGPCHVAGLAVPDLFTPAAYQP